MIADRENVLDLPPCAPEHPVFPSLMAAPGSVCALRDPPAEARTDKIVAAPAGWKPNYGPASALNWHYDAATVFASTVPELWAGDWIVTAPWSGVWFEDYEDEDGRAFKDVLILGRDDDLWDTVIFRWVPAEWLPLRNWMVIQLDFRKRSVERTEQGLVQDCLDCGTVLAAGPDATFGRGRRVVTHEDRTVERPDDSRWFTVAGHPQWSGPGIFVVREVDSEGVRRVWGLK